MSQQASQPARPLFPCLGAFESTKIHGAGTDVIETTRHLHRWREDLDLLKGAGLTELRYSAPWHRIESSPGCFDFSWMDGPMQHMQRSGMNPIIDLLHHTSFPDWLKNGFSNPAFPGLFSRFVERFARRYPWVRRYTIFNEPLPTTLLCSYIGTWYPYRRSHKAFVQMGVNVARAILLAEQTLRILNSDFEFVYIDTCEHHVALDRRSEAWVEYANTRRFWMLDLVLGKLTRDHPLFTYLTHNGLKPDDMRRFGDNCVQVDVLGLDYYPHSEMDWCWNSRLRRADIRFPVSQPQGFRRVAAGYVERYGIPIMLSETNIRGTVTDRLTWLRFMHEECEALVRSGTPVGGFCWYPSVDSTDWSNLCASCTGAVDPQGIWCLDAERETRFASELSHWYSQLACGTATAQDLPAYCLQPPLDRDLSGYLRLMSHWDNWIEAPEVNEEAA